MAKEALIMEGFNKVPIIRLSIIDYYKLNKTPVWYCFKWSVFGSTIFASFLVYCFPEDFDSKLEAFLTAEIAGNGFGLVILLMAFFDGYWKARKVYNVYQGYSMELKEQYEIRSTNLSDKWEFTELKIFRRT